MGQTPQPLRGRTSEQLALTRLLDTVRQGESAAFVVRGEAGVGKTALLQDCARRANACRVAQLAGIESEMELPFAALHQLCSPMLDLLGSLPEPQQDALQVAFGLALGQAPDRFLVALATLNLLAEVAAKRPLLCVVDDAQWLDDASAQVLGFVARRLLAESVVLLFAVREPHDPRQLTGLPELRLAGLPEADARALLTSIVPGRLDDRVRDRLVAETHGNPLALHELPRAMTAAELAGGYVLPGTRTTGDQIEHHYMQRVQALPDATQQFMLLAAADPTGEVELLWLAAEALGLARDAAAPAEADQLLEIGASVRFSHPLVRSAAYRVATLQDRRAAHTALAAATDRSLDPDRRAWHLAAAALGPDEEVALELERSASRAQSRGGLAAAAAFLQRSVTLTQDSSRRTDRALAAAHANLSAGAFDAAREMLDLAESGELGELQQARVEMSRGRIASASGDLDATVRLLRAAKQLEALDVPLARETYLDAFGAALYTGSQSDVGTLFDVARATGTAPGPSGDPRGSDLLLDACAQLMTEGRVTAAPALRTALDAFLAEDMSVEKGLQWSVLASWAAAMLWDFETFEAAITRQLDLARVAGALAPLSFGLAKGLVVTWRGDLDGAAHLAAEADAIVEATGVLAPYTALLLAAFRGHENAAVTLIETAITTGIERREGLLVQFGHFTKAILYNGLGRYDMALAAGSLALDDWPEMPTSMWVPAEVVEAGVRSVQREVAAGALERLVDNTAGVDSDWALGILARSRALVSDGDVAEGFYSEAIERVSRTPVLTEVARTYLLYGEWLRRENRRVDARQALRTAYGMFTEMGIDGFAERTRRELLATGEKVRRRRDETSVELTPQEAQVALLAREGDTNREIGAKMYLSDRTVEYHLRKVFVKLGIGSRRDLRSALSGRGTAAAV